jgi:hypothetical protein
MIDISEIEQGSIPAASTNNTPSNIQRRPRDGVFICNIEQLQSM